MSVHQQPVDDAEGGVEHPPPGLVAEHGRDDVRKKQGRPHEAPEGKGLVEQERHDQPQAELEDGGDPCVEEGVDDGSVEDAVGVAELETVVAEADELAQAPELRVRDRKPDPEQEGVQQEDAQDDKGWRQQEIPQRRFAVV
ncbi:MAG: hypothetical protein E6I29_10980, partial [Chloroflexi bacterium]